MHFPKSALLVALLQLFLYSSASASSEPPPKAPPKPCTIDSPTSGSHFDLNKISLSRPGPKDGKKVHNDDREESYHAKGYDYPANFTINFCAPVIEDLKDVVGVEEARWRNVSAYYKLGGKTYSIG
jgi:cation-dependent mannose-6-phosphate receptor